MKGFYTVKFSGTSQQWDTAWHVVFRGKILCQVKEKWLWGFFGFIIGLWLA